MELLHNPAGGYHFLTGIEPYSSGVVAAPGYEIVRAALRRSLPWRPGMEGVAAYLASQRRPPAALCGVELRSPAPFTRAGFVEFNAGYIELLAEWGLHVDGRNPVARTNVAPLAGAPPQPALFAFSYTRPALHGHRTFVVAGAGELGVGPLLTAPVVRPGESSAEAMGEKAACVMGMMEARLAGLGASWEEVTAVDLYTPAPDPAWLRSSVIHRLGPAGLRGLHWYPSLPPIDELLFEMDARGVAHELLL